MKIKRSLEIQEHAKVNLIDLFHQAKMYYPTNNELTKRYIEIKERLLKKTPYWVTSYLDGYREALIADLYKNHLDFRYIINGVMVSTHKQSDIYLEKMGFNWSDCNHAPCGHYWTGTEKPFSDIEPI